MTATVFYRHFHTLEEAGHFLSGRWQGSLQTYHRSSHAVPVVEYELFGRLEDHQIILEAGLAGLSGPSEALYENEFPSRWLFSAQGEGQFHWQLTLAPGAQLPRRPPRKSPHAGLTSELGGPSGTMDVAADNLGGSGDSRIDWNIYALTEEQIYLCAFDSSEGKRTVMLLGNLNRRRRRFWPAALTFIDSRRRR